MDGSIFRTHYLLFCLHAKLSDDPAADHDIALEEDSRLPGRDIPLRRIKLDLCLIPFKRRDQRLRLFRRVADLHLRTERFLRLLRPKAN